MIIKKMILKNFRQYMGINEIAFSSDCDKNVTVIISENNGAGKTTLLEAFNWCFYRNLNLPNSDQILTGAIMKNMKDREEEVAFVEIHLSNKGKNYIINRKNIYIKIDGKITRKSRDFNIQIKNSDGILENIDSNEIENIIPEDLSMYFFFDGERIENLSQENTKGKKDIGQAVKNILGLDILVNAQKHLKIILKEYDNEYDAGNSEKMKGYQDVLVTKEEKLNKTKKDLDVLSDENEEMKKMLRDYDKKLISFDKVKELQKSRTQIEQTKRENIKHIDTLYKELRVKNKLNLADYITSKILSVYVDKFNMEDFEDKGVIGIDGKAIDQLLKRGVCLCGNKIEKGSEEYNNLIEQKKYQPPASLAVIAKQFNQRITECKNSSENFREEINNINRKIETINEKIDGHSKNINQISLQINNAGGNIEEIETKRNEIHNDLKKNEKEIIELKVKIKEIKNIIDKVEGNLDELAQGNEKNRKIYLKKLYVNQVKEKIEHYYSRKENEIIKNLNEKVSEVFLNLIETNHKITINDDYTFSVIDEDGIESTSTGQNIITTLGFIGGIIKLAREGHDEIEVSEQYPLILDAPLSDLSTKHKKNVAKVLPNIAEQLIIFTLDKDYYSNFEEVIKSKVGKVYKLIMNQEEYKRTIIERCKNVN